MSDIPFIDALGDALETAVADRLRSTATADAPRARRIRPRRGRRMLIAALAILTLGAAAAVAATLSGQTSLVAGGIACYEGTGTNASAFFNVEAAGRSPEAACRDTFARRAPSSALAGRSLVACTDPHGYVAVFEASGDPAQCRHFTMSPLPRSYTQASARVETLVRDLNAVWLSRDCIPAQTLIDDTQSALDRLGFVGWHARPGAERHPGGACGMFRGTGITYSDPAASLDAKNHVVWIDRGPSRSAARRDGFR